MPIEKKPKQNQDVKNDESTGQENQDNDSSSHDFESNGYNLESSATSAHRLDGDFKSFINSTQTLQDE